MMRRNTTIIAVVVVALVVAGIFLFMRYRGVTPEQEGAEQDISGTSLGEELFSQVQSRNPAADLPETNPFSEGKTNPLKNTYKNPFE